MNLERDVIEAKFDIIHRNLRFLRELQTLTADQFVESYRDVQAAKYSLLEIMEACIDIANYLIALKGFRRAEEYSEMFQVLKEEGIITDKLAIKLGDMARFRNLLVHRYGEIDNKRVLEIIKHNLTDVQEYEKKITEFIQTSFPPTH
ncbi:MAG: type VII toxin-antitoxin system HepT family RNase toxin [Thermoproteota archaeon]